MGKVEENFSPLVHGTFGDDSIGTTTSSLLDPSDRISSPVEEVCVLGTNQNADIQEMMGETDYVAQGEFVPSDSFEVLFQYDPDVAVSLEEELSLDDQGSFQVNPEEQGDDFQTRLAEMLIAAGVFNFEGPRVPVESGWNIGLLHQLLQDYPDNQIIEFLEFGWPIERATELPLPDSKGRNHMGAVQFPDQVDAFIQREINNGVLSGPHDSPPLKSGFAISPINTCAKCQSRSRRFLMDLSWPQDGTSINAGLDKDHFLGEKVELKYPTVWDFIDRIKQLSASGNPKMYKRDLERAFFSASIMPFLLQVYRFHMERKILLSQGYAYGVDHSMFGNAENNLCNQVYP